MGDEESGRVVADAPETNMKISRGERPELDFKFNAVENLVLFDQDGSDVRFGDIYKRQKTIIIFGRHFLCFMFKEYVDDLALIPDKYFEAAGVKVVVIGCAPYKFIKPFCRATGYRGQMYCDPDRTLYKELALLDKFKMGITRESKHVKSNFVMGVLKSTWRGMSQKEMQGDVDQQGASFILGPGDTVHYKHIDLTPTDHTPINDLLALADVEQVNFEKDKRVISI